MVDNEMLRRLRSGMNAMFDAASAEDTGASSVGLKTALKLEADYNALHERREPEISEPPKPIRLDDSSGYRRSTDESFTEAELAFMTGGKGL